MNDRELIKSRWLHVYNECEKHKQKIQRSLSLLSYFPVTVKTYETLGEVEIEHIDQLIYRFTKLQDSIGNKLLPISYKILEPRNEETSFIDILSRLERLKVLPNVDEWLEFRSLRNELSHEYPDQTDTTVENLNTLYERMPRFLDIYNHLIESLSRRDVIPGIGQ